VARTRPPDRLEKILDAAMHVFGRLGLARAKMSDIATEAGVSQGTLYNYVESKEALFRLLLDRGLTSALPDGSSLPLATPSPGELAKRTEGAINRAFALPRLDRALRARAVPDAAGELREIVEELFDRTVETRAGADVLERSAHEVPELAAVFYGQMRDGLLGRLVRLIEKRERAGHYRAHDPSIAARSIVETVTYFGRHRHRDPAPEPFDDALVRKTVPALIVASMVNPRG
jgi:AcrR family transcriptional regulator